MPTWDANQYLRFSEERSRPCRELAARVTVKRVERAIDLGCGPGNSTAVVAERWPTAKWIGLDSSPQMIEAAKKANPSGDWRIGDIAQWADESKESFDIVFSNAALQWVNDHAKTFPKLLQRVISGGALAIQMPGNFDSPAHTIMRDIARSDEWRSRFPAGSIREWNVHDLPFYYEVLAPHAASVDLWLAEYLHIMPDAAGVVEWYKGTGLRPFLDVLKTETDKNELAAEYLKRIAVAYPPAVDGRVIFPFRRLFMIAYAR